MKYFCKFRMLEFTIKCFVLSSSCALLAKVALGIWRNNKLIRVAYDASKDDSKLRAQRPLLSEDLRVALSLALLRLLAHYDIVKCKFFLSRREIL